MTDSSAPASGPTDRARWQAFAVAVGVAALTILDLSKVNVGLPSIEESLGAGSSDLQLIVAGYALAFGLTLVPAGRLGDMYSRKLMFIIGLSAFTAASVLCALAPTIEVLVIGRILQGLAAGIQMPQVIGLVQELFRGEERGRAFGLFGATIGVSTAFGPTLGGLLIAIGGPTDGWRLLFWMNIPLGLLAIVFAARLLPKPSGLRQPTNLDPIGVLLLGAATFSLLFPFVTTTGGGEDSSLRWLWLLAFAGFGALFVWWEVAYRRRGKSPVVHFAMFARSSYRNGVLVATAYFGALPAVFLLSTLYLQQGLGLAPVFAGLVSIPFALTSAISAFYGGRLVARYGRALVVTGLVFVIVGFTLDIVLAITLPAETAPYGMAAALLVAGIGGGFVIAPNQTLTLAEIPVEEGGVAGSMGQLGQRVGTAVGTAAATSLFFGAILQDTGQVTQLAAYHHGFRNGMLMAVALIVLALGLAIADLVERRRARA
ncbi:EmrB/QacA subfamily drug resistance transporter [Glaciihabitans tibetensis]|uniref:EmrB/QacA subfamily drug resistance transporter n=1 Tax=Glaciihabitans tibetensis TaxID=1266600 RepID=A0A2T0VIE2_9MICO|nr:MFS transporter [Glaciihabitans tibetensis]PRY70000.1 EmrB/QacA subfamily drug resistance transporter [Glaciihabitans tibetensis]